MSKNSFAAEVAFKGKSESLQNTISLDHILLKMSKEIITFGGIEIGKRKFHNYKNPFFFFKKKSCGFINI